jgi:hypothetical protein
LQNVVTWLAKHSLIAILLPSTPIAYAQSAGTILFKSGNAVVLRADQSTQPIQQHDDVLNGDTIDTKNGRVQIGFIDGGKVSLQPETIYKINRYSFSGEEDGSEYALTELIKGGLRTISGIIGHKNHERYQLATPVATIGIRGTEFTVIYANNQLIMTTNQGSVDVCNQGGCRNAIAGQSIQTNSSTSQPTYTNQTANITAAPPSITKPIFIQAENLGGDGISEVVTTSAMQTTLNSVIGAGNANNQNETPVDTTQPTQDNQTDMLLNGVGLSNQFFNYLLTDGTLASNANNNLSTYQTNDIDLQLISANLGDVIASTAPVLSNASRTLAVGTPNTVTGNLSVNFATYAYQYGLNVPIGNLTYSLTGTDTLTAGSANFSSNANISSNLSNIGCLAGCNGLLLDANGNTASVVGRFIGPNAERAGIQYGFSTDSGALALTGSVILGQPNLNPPN